MKRDSKWLRIWRKGQRMTLAEKRRLNWIHRWKSKHQK